MLATNTSMLKVFEAAAEVPIQAVMEGGVYQLTIPFSGKEDA